MAHFKKLVHVEWHYNEAHHGKGPMDSVVGTIKRVAFEFVKSNKITINTAEEFATEASKAVPSIRSIYLSQDDEISEPSFVKVAPYIHGTLDTHYVKCSFNSNGVCFLKFYRSSNDLEPFHVQFCSRANTLLCDYRGSESNKNECRFCKDFIMKMKRGFSVLLARYGSMKCVLENNFSGNFKDMRLKFRC